jgi:hypothetical protein
MSGCAAEMMVFIGISIDGARLLLRVADIAERERKLAEFDMLKRVTELDVPAEEFNRIVWDAQTSPHFATGKVRGYFGGEPPIEFWRLLAFCIGSNTLSSSYWAIPFGQSEIGTLKARASAACIDNSALNR